MKLLADQINVFVESKTTKDGSIKIFTTSIGAKDKDGNYINKRLEVSFAKDALSKETLEKLVEGYYYQVELRDAFLTCRTYQNKDGVKVTQFIAKVLKCKVLGRKELAKKETAKDDADDLPF